MNHTAAVVHSHKTREIVAFLPIAFGPGVSMWLPTASPTHRSNMVAWEKRRSLVMKSCPISMPARRMLRWRAYA